MWIKRYTTVSRSRNYLIKVYKIFFIEAYSNFATSELKSRAEVITSFRPHEGIHLQGLLSSANDEMFK